MSSLPERYLRVDLGSPAYVAPEQAHLGDVGPASDLFSLGETLFAAVEGGPPFRRGTIFATLSAVVEDALRVQ